MQYLDSETALIDWLLGKEDENILDYEAEFENISQLNQTGRKSTETNVSVEAEEEDYEMDDFDDTNIINEDEIFVIPENRNVTVDSFYSETVDHLAEECIELQEIYKRSCEYVGDNFEEIYNLRHEMELKIFQAYRKYEVLKNHLENPEYKPKEIQWLSKRDVRSMPLKSRWLIYWGWISTLRMRIIEELQNVEAKCRNKMAQYEEYKQMEDLCIVKNARVVGMTTTGAARLQILLRELKPAIGKSVYSFVQIND